MKITNELIELLEKFNGGYKEDDYVNTEFRAYYIIRKHDRRIMKGLMFNRDNHKLAQANKLSKQFLTAIYNDEDYTVDYTGQIVGHQANPYESTGKNKYLKYLPSIYIM